MSMIFMLTVTLVTIMVMSFSKFYMSLSKSIKEFTIWLYLFVMSMLILLTSESWWVMFIGWEGLGLTSFWLVAYYSSWTSTNGSILTMMTNRLGDMALLCSAIYWLQQNNFYSSFNMLMSIFILMAVCSKSAQFPLISWLPAAMSAPTPISALVHSSTLVTAGLFLMIKFNWTLLMNSSISWWLGFMTLMVGSWSAMLDCDLKKVIAFSTLSQLGLLMMLFNSGSLLITMFHLISHAFFKSALFVCVGIMIANNYSNQSIQTFSYMHTSSLSHTSWLYLTLINLSAIPFVTGFYSKETSLINTSLNTSMILMIFIISILSLTFGYSYRILLSTSQLSPQTISSNQSLFMSNKSSSINWLLLVSLGYMWSSNMCLIPYNHSEWHLMLMLLGIMSIATTSWMTLYVFYYLTNGIKIIPSFTWINNLNYISHLTSMKAHPIKMMSWSQWTSMILILIIWLY